MIPNDLLTRLQEINNKTKAWMAEDPANRWAGLLTEDLEHWREYDVTTAAELDHYLLVAHVYEGIRSVWGYKPNWSALMKKTDKELLAEWESLKRDTGMS